MKLEYFIAQKLIKGSNSQNRVATPIIRIAVAAIAIGMVMMIIAVATGVGLQNKIREKVTAFGGHITISPLEDNQSQVTLTPISKKQAFYPEFTSVEGVAHIQGIATKFGILRTEKAFEGVLLKGVGTDYNWQRLHDYWLVGRAPQVSGDLVAEIGISQYTANRLELQVGDKIPTYFMREDGSARANLRVFQVSGIFSSGMKEFDENYILGDIRHVQRMNKWESDQVGAFEVFLTDFDQIQPKTEEIYQNVFNAEKNGAVLDTSSIVDRYYYIFDWLQLFDFNINVIIIIMLVVASVNMIVALLVLILERTQFVGLMKAIGANNWSIRKIFLYNAAYLIGKGLLWGNFIGLTLVGIQYFFAPVKLNPENYHVTEVSVSIVWWHILLLNLGTLTICLLVLTIPSYLITKISPVKALRFD